MWLLAVEEEHKVELRADFRQYYGVKYDAAFDDDPFEAADLAAMLPSGSRLVGAIDPERSWTREQYMGAVCANALSFMGWRLGLYGDSRTYKYFRSPVDGTSDAGGSHQNMTWDELQEALSRPRE